MPASKSSAVCRAVLTCSLAIRRASRILRSTDNCAIMNAGRMRSGIGGATAAEPSVELSISPAETVPGFSENSDLTTKFFAWADKMLTR